MSSPGTALAPRGSTALDARRDPRPERSERSSRPHRSSRHRHVPLTPAQLAQRWLLLTVLIAVGFAVWAFGGVYGWAYGCAYTLIFLALAVWGVLCWRGVLRPTWRPTYAGLFAFAALVAAQELVPGLSFEPAATLSAAVHLAAAGALYVLVTQCYAGDRDANWITAAFSLFTAALALLAILQILTDSQGIYWRFTYLYASPAGSFVNRNHFSGCMELLLPLASVSAWRRRNRSALEFMPWAAAPALGLAAVLAAASRGGLLALTAELSAAVLMAAVALRLRRRWRGRGPAPVPLPAFWAPQPPPPVSLRRRRLRSATVAALALAAGFTVAVVWSVGTGRIQGRLQSTVTYEPSVQQRDNLDLSSLAMFRRRPVAGWGLGTWGEVYPAFERFTDTDVFLFAHNDILQFLSENGMLGVMCALLFWGLWGREFAAQWRRWPLRLLVLQGQAPASIAVALAAALSCLGILVHSWVDYNLHIPSNLLLFFLVAALSLGPPRLSA